MQWLELTSEDLPSAVREAQGLCLLPFGVIERHGAHLPLGTDQIWADEVARRAAEVEPAVVFPGYWFGKIFTGRHTAGTISTSRRLILELLEAVLDEIARNGFGRILILNGHGGNRSLLKYFLRSLLDEPRDYLAYATDYFDLDEDAKRRWQKMRRTDFGDHGDEMESSVMCYLRPQLVKMERLTDPEDGLPRGGSRELEGIEYPMSWYAEHPTHYSGDARVASAEKGRFLLEACVEKAVCCMRAIKADDVTPGLQAEFYLQAEGAGGRQ